MNLYQENSTRIVENTKVLTSDILDLEKNVNKELYLNLFKFCYENLAINSPKFDIEPSYLFFYDKENLVNAGATLNDGKYIMYISSELVIKLNDRLNLKKSIFENERLTDYIELSKRFNVSLEYIMFQSSILFTYYHEFAHLVQKKDGNFSLNEIPENPQLFIPEQHILEYDSDLNGCQFVLYHLLDYFENLNHDNKNSKNLKNLLSVGLSSILITFLLFYNREFDKNDKYIDNFYLDQKTHPHSLIRISYIIQHYQNVALENGIVIEIGDLLKETFLISAIFFNSNSFVKNCLDLLDENLESINFYTGYLFDEAIKRENLVMQKHHLFDN
ncbi:hypothetical protein [uncultured Flavobacterium sp.]|uniref:hypothetical protein n=1 Tax=uncultured Flavobacterium sp. TaxID=165435 RepID=UPI0030EB2B85|tara:strand:- start:13400 stop:14392 length:993 start_codon:yes stop_codon:yes gene_type:complete